MNEHDAFPCWKCDFQTECPDFPTLRQLLGTLKRPADIDAGTKLLIDKGFELAFELFRNEPDSFHLSSALPALFDLTVNLHYIRATLSDARWIYCPGAADEPPSFYFAFVGSCPRHSLLGVTPPLPTARHKPQSGRIGAITGDVYVYMLSQIVSHLNGEYSVYKTTQRDVDVLIYGPQLICLVEVKASPLVAYPVEVRAEAPVTLTRTEDEEPHPATKHEITDLQLQFVEKVELYIPQIGLRLPLGHLKMPMAQDDSTLFERVTDALDQPMFRTLVAAWQRLHDAYVKLPPVDEDGNSLLAPPPTLDPAIWLTFGCGKPLGWPAGVSSIDDTKNRPGIDRTDDLKKGTYQVLKMGADFKDCCKRGIVRAALGGNFHAATHHSTYLQKLDTVKWTKEPYVSYDAEGARVSPSMLFNLYDALLCFTRSFFRNDQQLLGSIAGIETLEHLLQRTREA